MAKKDKVNWVKDHQFELGLYNMLLMALVLLHSAGYFDPYLPLSINIIVFLSILLAIVLLQINSRAVFSISLFFLLFALLMKIFAIDVWAERTGIYVFESFFIGSILLLFETFKSKITK
jgi:hypothetical protein